MASRPGVRHNRRRRSGAGPPCRRPVALLRPDSWTGQSRAKSELGELLAAAIEELDLTCLRYGDPENDVLAAAALCRSYLNGHLEAQQLTQQIHRVYGHDCHTLVESLSILDDSFDTLYYTPNPTREQLERRTYEAAEALQIEADTIYQRSRGNDS